MTKRTVWLAAWLMVACVVSSAGCRRRVAEAAEYKDAIARRLSL
jgi:hypothetical protein